MAWRTECGACHFAFDPALLPADDWKNIMSNLDKHFGADASLDDKLRVEIQEFLVNNGASSGVFAGSTESPRITRKDWFLRKHRGATRLVHRGKVKTLVACPACHTGQDIEMKSGE